LINTLIPQKKNNNHLFIINKQQILNIIQKLSKINDGKEGHCGYFAVALNRLIGNTGKYWVMSDDVEQNDRFYHVLL